MVDLFFYSHTAALSHEVSAILRSIYGYVLFLYNLSAAVEVHPLQAIFSFHAQPSSEGQITFLILLQSHQAPWPILTESLQKEFHCPFLVGSSSTCY